MLMTPVENVDAIVALALDHRPRRRIAIDTDQHGRRIERKRDRRGHGEAGSRLSGTGGDHAHPAAQMAHTLFERGKLLGLRGYWSKRHGHCAILARSEVSRLTESTITPSQKTLAQ